MTERAPIPQPEPAPGPHEVNHDIVNASNAFETIKIPAGEQVQILFISQGEVTIMINRSGNPTPVESTPTAPEPVVETHAAAATPETPKTPENERVDVRGYVATDPKYRERKEGKKTLKFVVAEHPDKTSTIFHNVTVWNERAEKLNGQLGVGEEVHVVGRKREFSYTDKKTGERKTSYEIYAFGVGKSKKPIKNEERGGK